MVYLEVFSDYDNYLEKRIFILKSKKPTVSVCHVALTYCYVLLLF